MFEHSHWRPDWRHNDFYRRFHSGDGAAQWQCRSELSTESLQSLSIPWAAAAWRRDAGDTKINKKLARGARRIRGTPLEA